MRSHCFQEHHSDDPARLCMGLIFPPCRGRQLEYLADFVSNGLSRDSEIYYLKWRLTISNKLRQYEYYNDLKTRCIYIISSMFTNLTAVKCFGDVSPSVFYLSTDKSKGTTAVFIKICWQALLTATKMSSDPLPAVIFHSNSLRDQVIHFRWHHAR